MILDTLANLTDIDKLACERIYAVIRSLKTFARVNEGDLRKVDMHEILLNTLKLSGCVFRRRVTVVTNFGELPEVECYPGLLNQVFLNLVVNAAQAIQGDGTMTVNTQSGRELGGNRDCRYGRGDSAGSAERASSRLGSRRSRSVKAPDSAWR